MANYPPKGTPVWRVETYRGTGWISEGVIISKSGTVKSIEHGWREPYDAKRHHLKRELAEAELLAVRIEAAKAKLHSAMYTQTQRENTLRMAREAVDSAAQGVDSARSDVVRARKELLVLQSRQAVARVEGVAPPEDAP